MPIETVGVLGAGVMGTGVAQVLAQCRHHVIVVDIAEAALGRAQRTIRNNLRFASLFDKSRQGEDADAVIGRVDFSLEFGKFEAIDFLIENLPEKPETKRKAFEQANAICPSACIFASNTSAIPIGRLAEWTGRPDRTIGTHFMNPVPLKPLVEVVCGVDTSEETLQATRDLLASLGKECIVVKDSPGFVSNRVLMLTLNEATELVDEGVASAEEVDRIFKECFGHRMGPLETADLIGLDTVRDSLLVLRHCFEKPKYEPCRLLNELVKAGRLGRKSGEGFFTYPEV